MFLLKKEKSIIVFTSLRNTEYHEINLKTINSLGDYINLASNFNDLNRFYIILSLIIVNMNKKLEKVNAKNDKHSNLMLILIESEDLKK